MVLFSTMPLGRKTEPFDHQDWIFELKYDGFRALAVLEFGRCTLYSRNGHPFASFSDLALRIGNVLMPRSLILDGEIVCMTNEAAVSSMTSCSGVANPSSWPSIFSVHKVKTCGGNG